MVSVVVGEGFQMPAFLEASGFQEVSVHGSGPDATLFVQDAGVTRAQVQEAILGAERLLSVRSRNTRAREAAQAVSDRLARKEAQRLIVEEEATEEEATMIAPLFDPWAVDESYSTGDIREEGGVIYTCVQAHTSQADWAPSATPALWTAYRAPGSVTPWVQPAGAHDAYREGERVSHNGRVWRSLVANNVWEPSAALPGQWADEGPA